MLACEHACHKPQWYLSRCRCMQHLLFVGCYRHAAPKLQATLSAPSLNGAFSKLSQAGRGTYYGLPLMAAELRYALNPAVPSGL